MLIGASRLSPLGWFGNRTRGSAERMALDPLTGLPMRDTGVAVLDGLCAGRHRRRVAAMALAIDEAERLAPRLGPKLWDLVTAQVGDRIVAALSPGDTIVRLSGARYALVLPKAGPDADALAGLAETIRNAAAAPLCIGGKRVATSVSIGVAAPTLGAEANGEALLDAAEVGLRAAQVHGPASVRLFDAGLPGRVEGEAGLADRLEAALASGEIQPWYQPQVSARDGRVTGVEALARWQHPERGTLPPSDFLGPVEAAGLGPRLFEVVLRHACLALRRWDADGLAIPHVAVNLDAASLGDPMTVERIRWELDAADLAPERLAVEICEDVVARMPEEAATQLSQIAALGCAVELDGFGTGETPVDGIRAYGIRRLKIDRAFVTGAGRDPQQTRLATALLRMARAAEIETVAAGVATEGEADLFRANGCGALQGFAIARPMPAGSMPAWLRHRHASLGPAPYGHSLADSLASLPGKTA